MTMNDYLPRTALYACATSAVLFIAGCASTETAQIDRPVDPAEWEAEEAPIMSRWAGDVSPASVKEHPYPRPQMKRERWKTLNGLWQYSFAESADEEAPTGQTLDGQILVPFPVESALSGVMERTPDSDRMFYRRLFQVPAAWSGERLLMHFGAVDWDATVYVNGEQVGRHKGGYMPFTFDVTGAISESGPQEVILSVYDPTSDGDQARGKQVKDPGGIWYTPVTGIWQTVWLEPVPQRASIKDVQATPNIDDGVLHVAAKGRGRSAGSYDVEAVARDADGNEVGRATGSLGERFEVPVPDAELWSPSNPYLYDLTVRLMQDGEAIDEVDSYFGMREIEVQEGEGGEPRLMLNDEFVFQVGPLDQGYWPDGLYAAPTDEALLYDLEQTKKMGFNMTRKHVKVEPARWYYYADSLGLLVWQDMPNGDNQTAASQDQFEQELQELIDSFYDFPSIVAWVVFNEGWGQYEAERVSNWTEEYDPSRLTVDVSGWQHVGEGDVIDIHRYQGPVAMKPEGDRASLVGEFGGLGLPIEGHLWKEGSNWGYESTFDTRKGLYQRYEQLMKQLWHSKDGASMSGGIYTQLTDVEVEVNGLMTYDRDVTKMDRRRVAAVNKGITPYILPRLEEFIESADVKITNWADNTTIRYTTDGSDPTASSEEYTGSFSIDEPTTVRARAFRDGEAVSPVAEANFEQVEGYAPAADASNEQLRSGMRYQYFEGGAMQNDRFAQHWPLRRHTATGKVLDAKKSGSLETFSIAPHERDELFAFQFDGYFEAPRTGVYTFTVRADDGVNLLMHGEKVNERTGQSPRTAVERVQVPLQAGLHPFTMRHFQAYGPSALDVSVEGPGMEQQPLTEPMLHHQPDDDAGGKSE
jgi:hypothetical protein